MNKKNCKLNINNNSSGFTLVEIIIAIGMSSLFTGLMLPSFLNLIRTEKVNSYTRELREFFELLSSIQEDGVEVAKLI